MSEQTNKVMKTLQEPLGLEHVDFMPKTVVGKDKKYALILAYKDARVDMKRLDEATDGLWQNKYERDAKGVLQCGIGIKFADEWVWKWSNGTPSDNEAEKGEYSDAFKRAGFMWGIGRELYEYPTIFVELQKGEWYESQGKTKLSNSFTPQRWKWEQDGKHLTAKDFKGNVRVDVNIDAMVRPDEALTLMEQIEKLVEDHKINTDSIKKAYGVENLSDMDEPSMLDLIKKLKAKYEGSSRTSKDTSRN